MTLRGVPKFNYHDGSPANLTSGKIEVNPELALYKLEAGFEV